MERPHWKVVGTAVMYNELLFKVCKGIKAVGSIEAFLVFAVAALHFAVMPGCFGANCLMDNMKSAAKNIQRMDTLCSLRVGKFPAIVCLDYIWRITKVNNCTLHKVYRAVAAGLLVGVNEPFPTGFFYHGILVEFLTIRARITGCRHIFHIHLPLFAQFCWCIIVPKMLGFLLGGFRFLAVSEPDKYTIQ